MTADAAITSDGAPVLDALAQALTYLSAQSTPSATAGLGEPRTCTTETGSLRHLNALCQAYRECALALRADVGALVAGARDLPPAQSFRISSSIKTGAGVLLRWDVILERTSYVGTADHFRRMGRNLGHTYCRRLAYCCASAADDPGRVPDELLHWLDGPAWFAEVEEALRAKTRRHVLALSLVALVGGLVYGLNG